MRFYRNWAEADNEIRRDLKELGIKVHPQTMQDKWVADDPDYETCEIDDYTYRVLDPNPMTGLKPNQPWADTEFEERVSGLPLNPGEAWAQRAEVWAEYLHYGVFAYTYAERMAFQLKALIEELKKHKESRQLYLAIWNPREDMGQLGGQSRVPCSLGYHFRFRQGQLSLTYLQRSCDFVTHFQNDVYLASRLLYYVASEAGVPVGYLSHWVGSLHVYAQDVAGVF